MSGDPPVTPRRAVLLVEDDEGDAFLVRELLGEGDQSLEIEWVRKLDEALPLLPNGFECVLLDLGLPDATQLDALSAVLEAAPDVPVIVLTGLAQDDSGIAAMAIGAQDYLVKGQVDAALLRRSIRYAVERKRADQQLRRLHASDLAAAENARLQWGLLPLALTTDERITVVTRYQPGHEGILGGDFFDVVETADGRLHLLVGDVCGHGPNEAALGVALRIAWRTLVLAGTQEADVLPILDKLVVTERRRDETFATLCSVVVELDRRSGMCFLAGHPAPLLLSHPIEALADDHVGTPLGLFPGTTWSGRAVDLRSGWRLMLFTDGLIEGTVCDGPARLGVDGLIEVAEGFADFANTADLVDHLIASAQQLHGGLLIDDVAVVVVECRR